MQGPLLVSYPSLPPPMRLHQLPSHSLIRYPPPHLLHPLLLPPSLFPFPHQPPAFVEEPPPLTRTLLPSSPTFQLALDTDFIVGSAKREDIRGVIVPGGNLMRGPLSGLRPS